MTKEELQGKIGQIVWVVYDRVDGVQCGTVPVRERWSGSNSFFFLDGPSGEGWDDLYVDLNNIFPTEIAAWEEKIRRHEREKVNARKWIAVQAAHIKRAKDAIREIKRLNGVNP